MKTFKLFTIAIILVSTFACKRKTTETFYFNCYINGQFFSPEKQQGLGEYPLTTKLLYDGTQLQLHAYNDGEKIDISIRDSLKIKITNYQLLQNGSLFSKGFYNGFSTDSLNTGIASIEEIDTQNMIVKGTFFYTVFDTIQSKIIHITDGKFRLKYDLH